MKFTRITVNPHQMGGVPCVRGLRIPVATVVGMVADGMAAEEILESQFREIVRQRIVDALAARPPVRRCWTVPEGRPYVGTQRIHRGGILEGTGQ